MSRFFRYSRISPLTLCREDERRAWRCALVLLTLSVAGALWALISPAPERVSFSGSSPDFTGIHVVEPESAPPASPAAVLPQAPALLCEPAVPFVAEPEPLPVEELECEPLEVEDAEPLLALEVPEALSPSSFSGSARRRERVAARPADAEMTATQGEMITASYRSTPQPPYPPSLLNRRVEGRVGLRISVDARGVPLVVEVSSGSGYAAFDRCAREWVLAHWRFHPARRNGVAVASIVRTQVVFSIIN